MNKIKIYTVEQCNTMFPSKHDIEHFTKSNNGEIPNEIVTIENWETSHGSGRCRNGVLFDAFVPFEIGKSKWLLVVQGDNFKIQNTLNGKKITSVNCMYADEKEFIRKHFIDAKNQTNFQKIIRDYFKKILEL